MHAIYHFGIFRLQAPILKQALLFQNFQPSQSNPEAQDQHPISTPIEASPYFGGSQSSSEFSASPSSSIV